MAEAKVIEPCFRLEDKVSENKSLQDKEVNRITNEVKTEISKDGIDIINRHMRN